MRYDPAAVLRAAGLTVEVEGGAARRSNGSVFHPVGLMVHHTAIGPEASDAGVTRVLRDGRSDLPGPLCQYRLRRDGSVRIIAYGGANHAGRGNQGVLNGVMNDRAPKGDAARLGLKDTAHGNRHFWGVECDNDGKGEGWSRAQMDALERLCVAVLRAEGWSHNRLIGHREWTARKIDPKGVDMTSLRKVVEWHLAGPPHAQNGTASGGTAARGEATWEVAAVNSLPVLSKGAGKSAPNPFVKRLQALLQVEGSKVQVTGVFDTSTANAVVASQKRHKITADGVVGRGTWTKLLGL